MLILSSHLRLGLRSCLVPPGLSTKMLNGFLLFCPLSSECSPQNLALKHLQSTWDFRLSRAASMEVTVFWDLVSCSLAETCCLHHQGDHHRDDGAVKHLWDVINFYQTTRHYISEDSHLHLQSRFFSQRVKSEQKKMNAPETQIILTKGFRDFPQFFQAK
jgi:hypothetical protein